LPQKQPRRELLIFKLRLKVPELVQVQALKQRKERRVKVLTALLSHRRSKHKEQLKRKRSASRLSGMPNNKLLRMKSIEKRKRRRMIEIPRSKLRLTTSPSSRRKASTSPRKT